MQRAAFFDLDKTVLKIDSGMSYVRFQRMRGEIDRVTLAKAAWWSLQYKLALLDVEELARRLARDYEGDSEAAMRAKCRVWYEAYVEREIAPAARRTIDAHRSAGDAIVLLTSSTQYIADVVAEALDMDVLCTRVEVVDGRFTGELVHVAFGANKVTLAEAYARERSVDLDASAFYSDSYNDLPMLQRVGRPVVVNPDARLRRHARRVRWPVQSWL